MCSWPWKTIQGHLPWMFSVKTGRPSSCENKTLALQRQVRDTCSKIKMGLRLVRPSWMLITNESRPVERIPYGLQNISTQLYVPGNIIKRGKVWRTVVNLPGCGRKWKCDPGLINQMVNKEPRKTNKSLRSKTLDMFMALASPSSCLPPPPPPPPPHNVGIIIARFASFFFFFIMVLLTFRQRSRAC